MKEVLRDYKGLGLSQETLAKAEHLREAIQSVIGEDTQYKVLGLKSKTITYKRGKKLINDRNKEDEKVYTKSAEKFSVKELCFFNNLNDLSKPEILTDYVDCFTIIDDELKSSGSKQLLMMRKTVNSLDQIVLYKTAIIFRALTEEEKLEMQAKEDAEEAASLGFIDDTLKSLASSF